MSRAEGNQADRFSTEAHGPTREWLNRLAGWRGTRAADVRRMAVRHYRDLIAWQLADAFATEVGELVHRSAAARDDVPYRTQILSAAESVASNVAEGFLRYSPAEFARFLNYALGSLAEAETRLQHGVRRGYFAAPATNAAQLLARRTLTAIIGLKKSQTSATRD